MSSSVFNNSVLSVDDQITRGIHGSSMDVHMDHPPAVRTAYDLVARDIQGLSADVHMYPSPLCLACV